MAALDLGSNSFHLLVARVQPNRGITKLGSRKEVLRLGDVVAKHGSIPSAVLERSLSALETMLDTAEGLGAPRVTAVGTSALRDARNGSELVRQAAVRFGLSVEILSGGEEGALVYRGACSSLRDLSDRMLVMDLGGGSVELAYGDSNRCLAVESLPLGFLRVARKLGTGAVLDTKARDRVIDHVRLTAAAAVRRFAALSPNACVLSGGTARSLQRIALSLGVTELSGAGLRRIASHLAIRDPNHLIALGVSPNRVRGFGIGISVIATLVELLGISGVRVSQSGLREGVLLRELARNQNARAARHAGISERAQAAVA